MKERIQKVLGNAGVASRRAIEEMVLQGRIAVNGKVVRELPVLIDPSVDRVTVDDEGIKLAERVDSKRVYVLLNKPKGVYSTNVAQGAQVRAIDLVPPQIRARLYPVGRLDAESHGLLLLTNDGELTHRLTHPRFGVPKTYRAIVDGSVGADVIRQLEEGIWLADVRTGKAVKTGPSHVRVTRRLREKTIMEITIREGVNREIRRMLAKLGHKVRDLIRLKMGPLSIGSLPVGTCRPLTPKELRELKRLAQSDGRSQLPTDDQADVSSESDASAEEIDRPVPAEAQRPRPAGRPARKVAPGRGGGHSNAAGQAPRGRSGPGNRPHGKPQKHSHFNARPKRGGFKSKGKSR